MREKNLTPSALLFDLDGTLIDTAKNFHEIINSFREENHLLPVELDAVRIATSQGATALVCLCWNIQANDPNFQEHKQQFMRAYKEHIQDNQVDFFPGIAEVLELINQQVPWGIVTNKHAQFTREIVKRHPLLNDAQAVVSGDTVEHNKPHPAPLLYACNQMLISPPQFLFIGDHEKDIQAGTRAGTQTGVALYGYLAEGDQPEQWGANYLFATPEEIFTWIKHHWKL